MRVAAVQMCSAANPPANLESAERLIARAARQGAEYVLLPEYFSYLGPPGGNAAAAQDIPGPATRRLSALAVEHGIYLHIGSMLECSGVDGKSYNTSVLLDPAGAVAAVYRKVHLFDVEVPGEVIERESDTIVGGRQLVLARLPEATLGLSICFDLRFPELYRALALAGADVFALPAAFAVPTGRVHWEILVRARAIENHAYVIAAGQAGTTPEGVASYGHSMIVGPWGEVLASAQTDGEEILVTDIDAKHAAARRAQIPVDAMRRPDVYATTTPGAPDGP
jgi:deaminated glutathione amidase